MGHRKTFGKSDAWNSAAVSKIAEIQTVLSVPADGIWGPKSQAALDALIRPAPKTPVVIDAKALGLQPNAWPREEDAAAFFGYPPNLTQVDLPYPMRLYSPNGQKVERVTCNIKVAASLRRIFAAILKHFGSVDAIAATGANIYDGMLNDRPVRGSTRRSMHAYAAAIDIDAEHNPLGATTGRMHPAVVAIFKAESWRWGGDYKGRRDWMHFEACK